MLKTNTRLTRCCAAGLMGLLLTLNAAALAGNLDAPAAPTAVGSAMFTLQDLCNRLQTGAAGAKRGGPFAEPTAGPAATMCTLNQIMAAMPTVDATGAGVADVLAGKTFWGLLSGGGWGLKTGTATAGANVTGTDGSLSMTIPDGLYSGSKTATATDSDLIAANIKNGVTIFGVGGNAPAPTGNAVAAEVLDLKTFSNASSTGLTGTMPNIGVQNITPGTTAQAISAGYHNGSGAVAGDANLTAANIKSGVTIFGTAGTFTNGATAGAGDILSGKTAYANGALVTGTYTAPSAPFPVAKTGDTTENSNNPKGVTWPNPRFTDNSNGTVTDNLTGLVWLKDANCASTKTWANAMSWAAALATGYDCANTDLSDGSVAGQWRLPTIKEFSSLVNAGASGPALPSGHPFSGVQSSVYWSSPTYAPITPITGLAWGVRLSDGYVAVGDRTNTFYVWPVRGGL